MKPQKSFTIQEIKEKLEHYCAYQDRCHFDVEQKLNDFFMIPAAKDAILIHLIQENYLNEERFVHSFVRGKFNQKKWGRLKIMNELRKRGIEQRLIESGLNEINEEIYFETAKVLILKKLKTLSSVNAYEKKAKVLRFMQQKGYEYSLSNEIYTDLDSNISMG